MQNLGSSFPSPKPLSNGFLKVPDPRLKRSDDRAHSASAADFAREVKLTPEEWMKGINFLTDVGHITDDKRQEFILLSDAPGLTAPLDIPRECGWSKVVTGIESAWPVLSRPRLRRSRWVRASRAESRASR